MSFPIRKIGMLKMPKIAMLSTGYILLYKRLAEKRFQWPRSETELLNLTQQEFRWLMEGLSILQKKAFVKGAPPDLY